MQYIIRTDQPFPGYVQSVVENGIVAWSGGLTPEEYAQARGFPILVIDEAELDARIADFTAAQITQPREITEDAWHDALNCLPPCRWGTVGSVELFHISERITLDLVDWFAAYEGRFYRFVDRAGANMGQLAAKVRGAR